MQAARPRARARYNQLSDLLRDLTIPSWLLVLCAILAFQLSSIIAKPVIEEAGAIDAIFLRTVFGAAVLLMWRRPAIPRDRTVLWPVAATGLLLVGANAFIFAAFDEIPVAVAVAIQFIGPIGLAVVSSHRVRDLLWALLAAAGIVLFTPISDTDFAPRGLIFAVISGIGFGVYLVFAGRTMAVLPSGQALTLTMLVATAALAPLALATNPRAMLDTSILLGGVGSAITAVVIGFSLEFAALARIRPALYGILICLEPAAAAILAWPLLGERLGLVSVIAITLVTIASIGASRSSSTASA